MSGKVLDLAPLLRRKKASACKHRSASVDDESPSLTCDDCEAEIEPWWFIRRMAKESEVVRAEWDAVIADGEARMAEGNARISKLNEQITKLNTELVALQDLKNRLSNEQFGGRLLGHIVKRPRQRSKP